MEAKIFSMLAVAALLIAAGSWVINSQSVVELRSKIVDTRGSIESFKTSIEAVELQIRDAQKSLVDYEEEAKKMEDLKKREKELQEEVEKTKQHATEMTQAALKATADLSALIAEQRKAGVGALVAELKLKSGKALKNCKVQKINEDVITVSHAEGVARLRRTELPDDWIEHYDIADRPKEITKDTESELASSASAGGPAITNKPADSVNVVELKQKIGQLEAQIHIYRANATAWQKRASDIRMRLSDSEAKGRIVTNKSKVDDAEKNAHLNTQKATELEAEILKLQGELYHINGFR